jgi:hypothetical protein
MVYVTRATNRNTFAITQMKMRPTAGKLHDFQKYLKLQALHLRYNGPAIHTPVSISNTNSQLSLEYKVREYEVQ